LREQQQQQQPFALARVALQQPMQGEFLLRAHCLLSLVPLLTRRAVDLAASASILTVVVGLNIPILFHVLSPIFAYGFAMA
jgi:hypothetical protein